MRVTTRLLKLMAPFRWWIVLAGLLNFATIGASMGLMALSAYLISKAAVTSEAVQLNMAITGVRFFAISRAALRYADRTISHKATFRILTHLRVWFYEAIVPLAPARLITYRGGDLLARIMADIETLENFYVRVIVPPLAAALVVITGSIILGSFNILLGVVVLFFMALTGLVLPLVTRWMSREQAAAAVKVRAELNASLVDQIQGLSDLTAFGQASAYQEKFLTLDNKLNRHQERLAQVRGLALGLNVLFIGLSGLTTLWLAIPLVTGGQLDGVYLALLPLTAIASFEAITPLSLSVQYLDSSKAAGRRLFELIDAPPAICDPPDPSPEPADFSIAVKNLSFTYGTNEPSVIEDLSFSLPTGGKAVVIGPSGAGKTTLLNLLLRFWEYDTGEIFLGGHPLRAFQAADVRRMIAVVSQQPHLFNSTIRDNLRLARAEATDQELCAACKIAGLHEFIDSLPRGYGTPVGENGLKLSGGERQRLAIARAVLKDAPILVLDEATAHLDVETAAEVWVALEEFVAGRTMLVISHRLNPAQFDQVIHLDGNKPHI